MKKLESKPFALIGVNSDKDLADLKQKLAAEQMTWRHFYDGSTSGPIAKAWNVHGWPTTYVIDQHGIIRHRDLRDEDAERAIEALLAQMAAQPAAPAVPAGQGKK